ncbi:putative replication factor-a protein [Phaeomoniella chlamydospora]|uniref:Putative replication factor-a protein n=1 Tax=Phaeomoniella chlamydospora TaxID=158046 RepID=A0A0G2EQK8_PHACM|nr:putative replication factor-a protein [Phaeomoniella chlamydospora]
MDYGYNNQYSTGYGATGGADGGGFMGGEAGSSPAGGKGGYGKDTLRPVTIKQILDAQQPHPDADFKIDGEGISQVTFVGQIRNISTQATNITYKVDDGTGTIEVKQWIDTDNANTDAMDTSDPSKPASKLVEDVYCRVWGRLKAFGNKRHIGAHVIRPISDYNEVNYHLLEATAVHLFFTRGPPGNTTNGHSAGIANGAKAEGDDGMNGRPLPTMSPMARKLFTTLKNTPQSNEGLHVQHLSSTMGVSTSEVYKASEELLSQGLIFTTVDDNTWAILEF